MFKQNLNLIYSFQDIRIPSSSNISNGFIAEDDSITCKLTACWIESAIYNTFKTLVRSVVLNSKDYN